MEILGYIALTAMGITLGLIGAGGSVLTIPILVYLFQSPILLATSYSLFLVGSTALVASFRYHNHILLRKSLLFLIPSILGVFISRNLIIPSLPSKIGSLSIDKYLVILLLIFMLISGYFMIKDLTVNTQNNFSKHQNTKIFATGLLLGIIMGLLGAGGGFLIIPTLVLLMKFTMQKAVPTSLFIITINSFVGFAVDQHHFIQQDWSNLVKYLFPSLLGMFAGIYIAKFMNGKTIKKSFGYFIWIVGITIFIKEFIL